MPIPPRVFWTLTEAAARWDCTPGDIAAWSMAGEIAISTGIPPVRSNDTIVTGLVQIDPTDAFPMFRRCGTGPRSARVRRIRPQGATDWMVVCDPPEGIEIASADLVIMAKEFARFEEAHEIVRRPVAHGGGDPKWGWTEMLQWLVVWIHGNGVPASQQELLDACRDWFEEQSPTGDAPTERSIRRYVGPVWKRLRAEANE